MGEVVRLAVGFTVGAFVAPSGKTHAPSGKIAETTGECFP